MPATTRRTRTAAPTATIPATPDEAAAPATDPAPATTPDATAPPTDPAPATTPAETTPAADPAPGHDTPGEAAVSGAPVSAAPVSGAPVGTGDHLKIVMVAGILGDHPDGVAAATIADESGLRAAIVGRVLAAMETAGAAVRELAPTGDDASDASAVELWMRGEADLTTVDLTAAAVRVVCPTCHRPMPRRNAVTVTRTGPTAPGHNSDGSRTLGKFELRTIVRDFLWAHPGHEFTPTTVSREIGRSSGATANALTKLVVSGEAVLVREVPATFAAPDTAADPAQSAPAPVAGQTAPVTTAH